MFCVTSADVESGVSFKVKDELFRELTQREGIIPAPYTARDMWVFVLDFNWLTDEEWERLILDSYELLKEKLPKKFQHLNPCIDFFTATTLSRLREGKKGLKVLKNNAKLTHKGCANS